MERGSVKRIVIIGAGNVATHITTALSKHADIIQVFSRNIDNAVQLAANIANCTATDSLEEIASDADAYIISVKDDAIATIAENLPRKCTPNAVWMHTSGSVCADVFSSAAGCYGVLYPLQTFSRDVDVNMQEVPFFIEGNSPESEKSIRDIALMLSGNVNHADSNTRRMLHVAAVFACNFTNHMWTIASEILNDGDIGFDVLLPLLRATLNKASEINPTDAQTGPAVRGDIGTMQQHIEILNKQQSDIYRILSESIMKYHNITIRK